jgi:hypothetical protein
MEQGIVGPAGTYALCRGDGADGEVAPWGMPDGATSPAGSRLLRFRSRSRAGSPSGSDCGTVAPGERESPCDPSAGPFVSAARARAIAASARANRLARPYAAARRRRTVASCGAWCVSSTSASISAGLSPSEPRARASSRSALRRAGGSTPARRAARAAAVARVSDPPGSVRRNCSRHRRKSGGSIPGGPARCRCRFSYAQRRSVSLRRSSRNATRSAACPVSDGCAMRARASASRRSQWASSSAASSSPLTARAAADAGWADAALPARRVTSQPTRATRRATASGYRTRRNRAGRR